MSIKKFVGGAVLAIMLLGAAGPGVALAGVTVTQVDHPVQVVVVNGDNPGDPTPGVIEAPCAALGGATTSTDQVNSNPKPGTAVLDDVEHCSS